MLKPSAEAHVCEILIVVVGTATGTIPASNTLLIYASP